MGTSATVAMTVINNIASEDTSVKGITKKDTDTAKKPRQPRTEFLNGLRGLAAILVVFHHAHILEEGVNIGATAVDIFFVLSSFLLTMRFEETMHRLVASHAGLRSWTVALLDYAIKRFFRVYPLFAIVALLLWWLPSEGRSQYYTLKPSEPYDLIKVLTFEEHSRYFVFWTLPLEIAYYFFIPLLVIGIYHARRFWLLAVVVLYIWVINEGIHRKRHSYMPLRPHLSTFVAGSLAAIVYVQLDRIIKQRGIEFREWKLIALVRGVQLGAFSLTLSLAFHGLFFHWFVSNPFKKYEGGPPFISLLISIVLVIEILFPSVLSSLLEWKLLTYAGKISFSMYLLHPFVIYNSWIRNGQQTCIDQFFAWFMFVFVLATISFWAIEYPSQLLAQRMSTKLRIWDRQNHDSNAGSELLLNVNRNATHDLHKFV